MVVLTLTMIMLGVLRLLAAITIVFVMPWLILGGLLVTLVHASRTLWRLL